ncbi:trypsin alpha-3-like [Atheta coriaria]|uniref:trypsin alpha-3-like n=1 Tax=Dalotia coriaria TaxID=877792 RepID=UPI0031F3B794
MKFFKVAILLCAVVAVKARARRDISEEDDDFSDEPGRIVGGSFVDISQVPYQAVLLINSRVGCGGSIIADRWILTAAHCVPGVSASQVRVRVGSSNAYSGGQELQAVAIFYTNKYNSRTTDYDVALIQVNNVITAGRRINLATSEPGAGTVVRVSGWGAQNSGGSTTTSLKAVDVSMVSRSSCQRSYGASAITPRMICAARTNSDSCQGDSGGPLAMGNTLVGIVSWGRGCALAGYPGVYTNVANSEIRQYIRQIANV